MTDEQPAPADDGLGSPLWRPLRDLGLPAETAVAVMRAARDDAQLAEQVLRRDERVALLLECGFSPAQFNDPRVRALPVDRLRVMAQIRKSTASSSAPDPAPRKRPRTAK